MDLTYLLQLSHASTDHRPAPHPILLVLGHRGATAKTIQELSGHVSLTTTQRYMHLSPAAKENAIRLLELDLARGEKGRATSRQKKCGGKSVT